MLTGERGKRLQIGTFIGTDKIWQPLSRDAQRIADRQADTSFPEVERQYAGGALLQTIPL